MDIISSHVSMVVGCHSDIGPATTFYFEGSGFEYDVYRLGQCSCSNQSQIERNSLTQLSFRQTVAAMLLVYTKNGKVHSHYSRMMTRAKLC